MSDPSGSAPVPRYLAMFSLAPVSSVLTVLDGAVLDGAVLADDADAQRAAITAFFSGEEGNGAKWEVRVQLCVAATGNLKPPTPAALMRRHAHAPAPLQARPYRRA